MRKRKKIRLPKWLAIILLVILGYIGLMTILAILVYMLGPFWEEIILILPFALGQILAYVLILFLVYKGIRWLLRLIKDSSNSK